MSTGKLRGLKSFQERLECLRGSDSKASFAAKIGISPPLYSQWLNGASPTFEKVRLISERLGVTVDQLLTGHEGVSRQRETSSTSFPDGTHSNVQVREEGNPYLPLPSEWEGVDLAGKITSIESRLAQIERLLVKLAGESP